MVLQQHCVSIRPSSSSAACSSVFVPEECTGQRPAAAPAAAAPAALAPNGKKPLCRPPAQQPPQDDRVRPPLRPVGPCCPVRSRFAVPALSPATSELVGPLASPPAAAAGGLPLTRSFPPPPRPSEAVGDAARRPLSAALSAI